MERHRKLADFSGVATARCRWMLALLGPAMIWSCTRTDPSANVLTGLIDATEIDVASKVPGRIQELFVKEGDLAQQGQKLLTIASEELRAKIDQVQAGIDAASAKLRLARHGARDEQKTAVLKGLEAARHQVDLAQKMYQRMESLRKSDAIPEAKFEEIEFKYKVAKDQLAMAEAKYEMVIKGSRKEEITALEALVNQGKGMLQEVESYNKEMVQFAPITGEVSKIILNRGELAATGYPILTLVDMNNLWATFAVREDMLKEVQKGAAIQLEVPALGQTIKMEIFNIAAMGDFATWQATSEKNNFDLKSFEVKARPTAPVKGLRPGMTVRWRVD